jgi:hypothetical protein
MKKPGSRLNSEQIIEQEALKYKDFNKLMNAHSASKIQAGKNHFWKYLLSGLSAVAISSLFFIGDEKKQAIITEKKPVVKKELVRPFPNIPVEYEKFTIQCDKQNSITSLDGSVITIPEYSLVDSLGNTVKGKVELNYREFRDMVDVFLSGIPMEYDSAGAIRHFESAGMFELLAHQNKKTVFIDPKKTVTVAFASQYEGNRYNLYYFDVPTQRWEYLCKDTSQMKELVPVKQLETIDKEINALKKMIALKPVLANPNQAIIKLNVLESEFPEIAIYKNVRFQLLEPQKMNAVTDTVEWDMVTVVKAAQGDYLLRMERGTETKEFACIPVFEKSDYTTAKKAFEENHKASQAIIKKKEQEKTDLLKKLMDEKTLQQNTLLASRAITLSGSTSATNQSTITRLFEIKKFGIFNSDCPQNLPQGGLFALSLVDSSGIEKKPLSFISVYLAEKNKNTLYTYYNYNLNKFSYNPDSKNLLWTVTKDNKLAIFTAKDFKALQATGKGEEKTFDMWIINVNFKNEAQIRKYLDI